MSISRFSERQLKPLLAASVALNLVLAANTLLLRPWQESGQTTGQDPVQSARTNIRDADFLSAAGSLPYEQAARLAASRELEPGATRYWESGFEQAYSRAVLAAQDELRSDIAAVLGAAARDNPLFGFLFRPMGPLFEFLDSSQQLAIGRLRFERDWALRSVAGGADVGQIQRDYQAALRELLSADELLELELRESPVASRIRQSGIEVSEPEFRESFRLLSGLQHSHSDPAAAAGVRQQLRELLGNTRFAQLWSSGDPFYAQLEQLAAQSGLTAATASLLYDIVGNHDEQRLQLGDLASLDPQRVSEQLNRIAAAERRELTALVGDELAGEILRARAVGSYNRLTANGMEAGR